MNKLFTKITSLALCAAMMIGVGVSVGSNSEEASPAHAADMIYSFGTVNSQTWTAGTRAYTSCDSNVGVSWTISNPSNVGSYNSGNYKGIQLGSKSNTGSITLTSASAWGSQASISTTGYTKITKVELFVNGGANNVAKWSASIGGVAMTASGSQSKNSSASSWTDASKITFTPGSTNTGALSLTTARKSGVSAAAYFCGFKVYCEQPSSKQLESIAIKTAPTKTTGYYEGQFFDPTGLVITATYSDESSEDISYAAHSSDFTFTPSTTTALTTSNTSVTIAYGGKSTSQTISVIEDVLNSVSVSGTMTKTSYSTADSWSSDGLTVTGSYAGKGNVDVTSSSTFKFYSNSTMTSEVATPSALGVGNNQTLYIKATCSGVSNSTAYSQTVSVEAAPDVVLSTSNKPYTSTSSSNTGTEEVTLDDIQYNSYAAYIYNSYLSFNRNQSGAYLYNDTAYSKNIKKIVVDYNSGGSSYFTMYEGATANTETSVVSPSASGTGKITYTFSDTNQFFKFKLTTTRTYCNINSISIYLGSAHKSLSSIAVKIAPTKTAYKANEDFAPAGLVITATYSDSSTEDIAYSSNPTAFGFSPSTITAAGNVTITYGGKTCTQAVTLITVTNVTGVASAPSEVYVDGSIDPSEVTLNVTYSDSSVGTVTADSVTCDTSATGPATATATYSAATGTNSATFNVTVKKAPTYDYISDDIIYSDLTATGTAYSNFSNLSKTTEALYKGNTSLQDSTKIGFRSTTTSGQSQHSGIVTTTSGGLINKVTVTNFDHATRILDVYGSNTAYSDPNDLYDSSKGTKLGSLTQASQSLTVTGDYAYVGVRSNDGLIKVSSISFTWKVEGAANPLIDNPTLSTGSETSIVVGKTAPLTITTNPVDSDEKLTVTSDDPTIVSVSGNDRSYTLTALATGSATVTVAGVKGVYKSSVVVTVIQAQKTYEDKILTATSLQLAASYADSDGSHSFEDVEYVTSKVCKTNGMQFQKDNGQLYNNEELYSTNNIKSITLIMNENNKNQPVVYEGTSAAPTTDSVSPLVTFSETGVNTYKFSSGKAFFRIGASASGAVNIDTIIIELEDSADSVLEEARLGALSILTDLSGNCGDGGSGEVTLSEWNTLNSNLAELDLSDDAKALLKNADRILIGNLSQGGAEIENAMAHYDACVTKFHYTPFADITNAQPSVVANPLSLFNSDSATASTVIIIISVIGVSALGGFFLRKRKEI
ncbi:MAG: hypothetical protein SPL75_02790 [Bacilli bacterium]|nr:hypothetical protein [Bacilli bacterium]